MDSNIFNVLLDARCVMNGQRVIRSLFKHQMYYPDWENQRRNGGWIASDTDSIGIESDVGVVCNRQDPSAGCQESQASHA